MKYQDIFLPQHLRYLKFRKEDRMVFKKQLMTISELEKEGFTRDELKNWVHIRGFPAIRNSKKGTWRIDTDLLPIWLIKTGRMKRPDQNLSK